MSDTGMGLPPLARANSDILSSVLDSDQVHAQPLHNAEDAVSTDVTTQPSLLGVLDIFPLEIITMILWWTCGPYFGRIRDFVNARRDLQLVSRFVKRLMDDLPELWTSFSFQPYIDARVPRNWVTHFSNRLLELRLFFPSYYSPRTFFEGVAYPDLERISPSDVVQMAVSCIHRCRWLYIHAEDIRSLPLIFRRLASANGDELESLTITRIPISAAISTLADIRPDPHLFQGCLPKLRYLRLARVILSWTNLGYYANLTVFVLHDLMDSLSPKWETLRSVLCAAPHLVHLSLRRVRCPDDPRTAHRFRLALPSIRNLDVCFCGGASLATFLSCCDMRLDSLFFTFESPNDIQLLTLLLPSLKSVTEFVASGFSADEASLHFLFTKLDRLEILDISHCNPVFCQALKLAKGESVSVCPHLVDLSVATIGYEQLLDLVKSRIPPAVKIELLTLQDRPPLLSDFVIVDEIESMVTDFNYDPGRWPYFDPSWIAPLGRSNSWRDSIM